MAFLYKKLAYVFFCPLVWWDVALPAMFVFLNGGGVVCVELFFCWFVRRTALFLSRRFPGQFHSDLLRIFSLTSVCADSSGVLAFQQGYSLPLSKARDVA